MLLQVKDIHKTFDNGKVALIDVNFTLNKGQCLGIVGESGSGKSTLAKIIAGIWNPSSGQIYFNEQEIKDYREQALFERGKDIQYIFQNPLSAFMPKMKIKRFMLEPFINYQIKGRKAALIDILQGLKEVELDESCLDKYPHQLSGGQLQRLVIARAILLKPQLIICDEMTSALDVVVQAEILKLLKSLQQKQHLTLLFISHDLAVVKGVSDTMMVMYEGQAIEQFDTSDFLNAQHPYTKMLIESSRAINSKER